MDFSDKLNAVFEILGCSNSQMANACDIDPSIISRFRNRARVPKSNSLQLSKLCAVISYYESQIDALLEMSKPLLKVFNELSLHDYHFRMTEMSNQEGETKKLLSSFSIATMPKSLLEKILLRSNIDKNKKDSILSLHNTRVKQFEKELQSGSVFEYLALPDENAIRSDEVELNFSDLYLNESITYRKQEYLEHMNAIISLIATNENYKIIILPESPFLNIQFILKVNIGVMVLKSDIPSVAFWFGHPVMCKAFNEFTIALTDNLSVYDKNGMISMLRSIINSNY